MGLEIDVIGVGDASKGGDAIALRYGNLISEPIKHRVLVVDGGYTKNGEDLYKLITERYKTHSIYIAILTHPDDDHVQGLKKLFEYEDISVENLIMHRPWLNESIISANYTDGRITNNSICDRLKKTFSCAYELSVIAEDKGTRIIDPQIGSYDLFDNAKLTILAPSNDWYIEKMLESEKTPDCGLTDSRTVSFSLQDEYEDYNLGEEVEWKYDDPHTTPINETSIVSLFKYENKKIMFTGDVGRRGLELAIEAARELRISLQDLHIFISPHHGSRKNMTPELMDKINSNYTFLSTPKKGDPHHPSRRLVNKYIERKHKVYETKGQDLHWGVECPDRNWGKSVCLTPFDKIEKNA